MGGSIILAAACFSYFCRKRRKSDEDGEAEIIEPNPNATITHIDHMDWKKLQPLGSGSYGSVHLAINRRDGALFAVKTLHTNASQRHVAQLESEICMLSKFKHENIVKYYGAMNTDGGFFMYLEYVAGGTLQSRIRDLGKVSIDIVKDYTQQMLEGLKYMHEHNVIHRDLKPANVLISVEGKVKLADFGTAFDLSKVTHTVEQTLCGTPAYIAPEVVQKGKHTTSTDIWSLGVIVYNMMTGDTPFAAKEKYALLLEIAHGPVSLAFPPDCPIAARDFIGSCLSFDPSQRPPAGKLLEHTLISDPTSASPPSELPKHALVSVSESSGTISTRNSTASLTVRRSSLKAPSLQGPNLELPFSPAELSTCLNAHGFSNRPLMKATVKLPVTPRKSIRGIGRRWR